MMDACAQSMWAGIAAAKIDGKLTDQARQLKRVLTQAESMEFCGITVAMELVLKCTKNHIY